MHHAPIGSCGPLGSRLIYGCMRLLHVDEEAADEAARRESGRRAVRAAWDAGYTHFDHADIYGGGQCEAVFGEALRESPSMRERLLITTKCGIRPPGTPHESAPHRFDFSREHILRSAEGSLERLGIETIDVFLLHRPDALMEPEEVAGAFDELRAAGKVRHFGVSNFELAQIDHLRRALTTPLVCNQIPLHAARTDPFENGLIIGLSDRGITPTAYSPLAGGALGSERADGGDERWDGLRAALDEAAEALGTTRTAAALAWLMRHPASIQPIVGTHRPERIREAAAADGIEMDRETWYRIFVAGRGRKLP